MIGLDFKKLSSYSEYCKVNDCDEDIPARVYMAVDDAQARVEEDPYEYDEVKSVRGPDQDDELLLEG